VLQATGNDLENGKSQRIEFALLDASCEVLGVEPGELRARAGEAAAREGSMTELELRLLRQAAAVASDRELVLTPDSGSERDMLAFTEAMLNLREDRYLRFRDTDAKASSMYASDPWMIVRRVEITDDGRAAAA
jgi:hypothetical protein